MARSEMKTISTLMHPTYIEKLVKRSGVPLDANYIATSIIAMDVLLDDKARADLLEQMPELNDYAARKSAYKDFDFDEFALILHELIDATEERHESALLGKFGENSMEIWQQCKLNRNPFYIKVQEEYDEKIAELTKKIEEMENVTKVTQPQQTRTGPQSKDIEVAHDDTEYTDLLKAYAVLKDELAKLKTLTSEEKPKEIIKEVVKEKIVKEKVYVEKIVEKPNKKLEKQLVQMQQKQDDLLAENKDLRKQLKALETAEMRTGPRLEQLETENNRQKEELKRMQTEQTLLQNNLQNRDAELAEKEKQIDELKELLANALVGKDAEGKGYELELAENAEMQKIKNQADIARPIIARIRDSIETDRNYAVYLLKVRDKQFYFARIVAFAYDTTTDKYYENAITGEREYLKYIVTTEHYVNGSWVLNKEGERITNAHLTNRAVDHACVPFTKKAYHSLMHMIYNEDSEKRVPLPTYTTQSVVSSPYNTNDLFNVSPAAYFETQGINQQSDQYTIACYMVHLVRYYRKKVDTRYLHEMLKFIDALENAKTKKASVNKKNTKKGA